MRSKLDRNLVLTACLAVGLFSSGCATRAIQTERLLATHAKASPRQVEIPGVPFIEQSEGYCGPATLAMTLSWAGKTVDVQEIARQVFTPDKKGTMPADLVGATRRQGMMGVQFNGLPILIEEISRGRPVIVFENLALTWYPRWHYAVAYGYDLGKETITLHSGSEKAKKWSLHKFERSWMLGEYWGLAVLPPGEISPAAGELANATAAAGLEQAGKINEAEKSYRAVLQKWPTSLGSLIGLGNVTYAKKDFESAVDVLTGASSAHPKLSVVWHNLATAQGALAKTQSERTPKNSILSTRSLLSARKSAKRAIELASNDEAAAYRESLKEWLSP